MIEKAISNFMKNHKNIIKNEITFDGFILRFKTYFMGTKVCDESINLEPIFEKYLKHVGLLK